MNNPSLHKIFWCFIGAACVASLIYGGLWVTLAFGARAIADDWIAAQRQNGWAISMDDPRFDGFPGWPVVVLDNVAITAPLEEGAWSWSTNRVTLAPVVFDLTRLSARAPGRHHFSAPWAPGGPWSLEAKQADFSIDLDTKGRLQHGHLQLGTAELQDTNNLPLIGATGLDLELALADFDTGDSLGPEAVVARFTGHGDTVRLAMNTAPFARTIRTIQLDADLLGAIRPGRLQEALNAWRLGGGTLEVRRILLDWPPLTIAGDGTLALDDGLQPIAAFSTRITGFNDALDALETKGVIPRGQTASAQVILNLLASTPRDDEAPELRIPLSVQDQRLSIGPFNVMALPRVRWD
jgi:hypothetical protein